MSRKLIESIEVVAMVELELYNCTNFDGNEERLLFKFGLCRYTSKLSLIVSSVVSVAVVRILK